MSDFVVPRRPGESRSMYACRYFLDRVKHDANFAHYTLRSGVMEAVIKAVAHKDSRDFHELHQEVHRTSALIDREADVTELRAEVHRLEGRLLDTASIANLVTGESVQSEGDRRRKLMRIEDLIFQAELGMVELTPELLRDTIEGRVTT